jgi:hypothetical protein
VDGWLAPRPGRLTTGKETRYPLYRKLGASQGRSGRVRKFSPPTPPPPTGIRSPDRSARSESLCRLSYRGPLILYVLFLFVYMYMLVAAFVSGPIQPVSRSLWTCLVYRRVLCIRPGTDAGVFKAVIPVINEGYNRFQRSILVHL